MSVSGLCTVCGNGGAEYTCDRCGSLVCERHYEPSVGFCVECAGDVSGGPGSDDRPNSSDTYRF
jgi:hypothetical protein